MKRKQGAGIKSWELTDGMWEAAQPFIPQRKREEGKTYQRKPGGGRKPLAPRQVLKAIFFVLRTGIQWKALPKEYGAASSVHEYFSMVKAPLAREPAGRNPADRGKKGTKRSLAVEPYGLPAGIAISGADRHDVKLVEAALQSIVTAHPEGGNLCFDAGYAGAQSAAKEMGYTAGVGKEREVTFKARRRVVEACHSWLNRFRKLLVRYEKKADKYLALLHFACAIIVWRQIIPVHPGLIPG